MASGTRIMSSKPRAIACGSVLCLLLALFSLVVPAASVSADVHQMPVELVSAPIDDHSDCDSGLAGMTGHCQTTTSCFAHAQAAAAAVSLDLQTSSHPKVASQDDVTGRSTQPGLRPPKRSIQA